MTGRSTHPRARARVTTATATAPARHPVHGRAHDLTPNHHGQRQEQQA
ncbi:hypothetical protein [Streptomyces violaceus]|uniref:Uncharacterized protein n=1 Tax=Streptomyces violaceus TaxID=1936 RepID=A0ABZ1P0X8_STRVL